MSPANKVFASAGFVVVACLFFGALLALGPVAPVYAQETTPNVAVITSTVDLATTTTSITVPVTLTVDAENISALTFQLDYDQTCIHIDDASSDVSGLPSGNGFANSVIDDPANGLLDISIWDTEETQTALTSGYVAVIEFTLEALCRTNNADTDIVFSFSSDPAVTFGATNGSSVSGASYSGT